MLWPSDFSELLILSLIPLLLMPPHVDPPPSDSLLQLASMRTCSEPRPSLYSVQAMSTRSDTHTVRVEAQINKFRSYVFKLGFTTGHEYSDPRPSPGMPGRCPFLVPHFCPRFAPVAVTFLHQQLSFFRAARASSFCTTSSGPVRPPR